MQRQRNQILDIFFLVGAAFLVCVLFVGAFIVAEIYHVDPLWIILSWISVGFFAGAREDYRKEFRSPRFVAFVCGWVVINAIVFIVLSIASTGSHGLGKVEIFNERNEQETPRSVQWGRMISNQINASFDHIAGVPIAVVDLTIKNLPQNHVDAKGVSFSEVGPTVAAVRLRRGAGIDWPDPGTCDAR